MLSVRLLVSGGAVTPRPQASLGRVLDDLGATLLELIHGDADQPGEIGGVVIHDPIDEPALPPNALVLGVGLREPEEIARLLRALGQDHAAGLVVRLPAPHSDQVAAAVEKSGVALLGLTRGATWAQLAALLRSMLAEGDVGDAGPQTLGGMPSGDLFALANAVAALLDAPVTIEDRSSRVLAFSGRRDEADRSRVETILGRQPPEGPGDFSVPRVAVAVRAGDEVLGSIWAAVHQPLSEERAQAMCDAARLVALHMLRIRAGADVERRLRADLVSTALEGGAGSREALSRLGLADQPVIVLAMAVLEPVDSERSIGVDASLATERQRLSDGLAMHLSAVHPRCATALVGDVVYGLVPVSCDGNGEQRTVQVAADFLERVGDRVRAVIGIGPVAEHAAQLADARASADRALRVLRAGNGAGHRVALLADVHVEELVLELRDLVAAHGDRPTGPTARLLAYDNEHNTSLVETLRAWLDAFGDVIAAAAAMYVHPNTFRYRLRRLTEVSGIDLTDPEARFAAMLQL
jgi:PucR C-terminal helix-turn-helix domain/GGDEF-like domain